MQYALLKTGLKTNAVFSFCCAVTLLLFGEKITHVMGSFDAHYLLALAAGLTAFSGYLFFLSHQEDINKQSAMMITVSDLIWVIVSVALILIQPQWLTSAGLVIIAGVAIAVGFCAFIQYKGIKQLTA